jgi:hypothetical protein
MLERKIGARNPDDVCPAQQIGKPFDGHKIESERSGVA